MLFSVMKDLKFLKNENDIIAEYKSNNNIFMLNGKVAETLSTDAMVYYKDVCNIVKDHVHKCYNIITSNVLIAPTPIKLPHTI